MGYGISDFISSNSSEIAKFWQNHPILSTVIIIVLFISALWQEPWKGLWKKLVNWMSNITNFFLRPFVRWGVIEGRFPIRIKAYHPRYLETHEQKGNFDDLFKTDAELKRQDDYLKEKREKSWKLCIMPKKEIDCCIVKFNKDTLFWDDGEIRRYIPKDNIENIIIPVFIENARIQVWDEDIILKNIKFNKLKQIAERDCINAQRNNHN